jgi:hypothetical protein
MMTMVVAMKPALVRQQLGYGRAVDVRRREVKSRNLG